MAGIPEKIIKNWSSKGKEEAISLFKKAYQSSKPNFADDMENDFSTLLYDLLQLSVTDVLDPEDVGEFCTQLSTSLESATVLPSLLTDILSALDAEVTCSEGKTQKTGFKTLVRSLVNVVGEDLLKERLDMDTLELTGLIASKNNYNQKYVKTKTKLFYKQQKFNLFREESEGYSKLVSELGHERLTGIDPSTVLESIKSLIGRFSLDPNRVLDVILEVFECHLDDRGFFVPFLGLYPCENSTFVNILGFKFQAYQNEGDSSLAPSTPFSLYQMTAILLNEGLVDFESLYSHLSLSDEELQELHTSVMEDAQSVARKANIVSLIERTDEEKEKEADVAQSKKEHQQKLLSIDINQKLGICHACIEQGNWESANYLIERLPLYLAMWSQKLVDSLCHLIHYTIEPLYRHLAPRGTKPSISSSLSTPQCHTYDDLLNLQVMEMLYTLGPQINSDPLLFCKLVRIGKAYFKETIPHSSPSIEGLSPQLLEKDLIRGFVSILDEVVFPSLSLIQCNCGIAEEVWSMLRLLPYETRYMLYGYWKNQSYDIHPSLMKMKASSLTKGRYIMKRLTKDNVKPSGRQIGKLSHNNPGIIFDYVLSQIQKYDNFIIPVVDSLKYLTPVAYDMLAYCIIEALGNPQKERMKHEDTNLSSWLQGLANFCANVFKKYPIELTGLLQYVTNQLKAGKSFDLLVLKEVIQKMAGIEISDEVTPSQLEAMAGGELLKAEGGYFSQVRNTKKSSQRLRESLVDSNLCLPLCLLTAQQRDYIIFRDGSRMHLKLVGSMYDNCMDTLVQFGGFLSSHLSPEEYGRRVPSLDTLVQDYRITGDVAFFLYRPRISSSIGVKFAELEKSVKAGDKHDRKSVMSRQEKHFGTACEEILGPIFEAVKSLQPPRVWEDLNYKLYVVFWSLTLYDLHVPKGRYEEEINKAKDVISALENNQEMPSSKKKKEQERSEALINRLQEEKKRQDDNHQLVLGWLRQEKDSWLNPKVTKNRTLTQFLQLCIFPRCCFTTTDAVYCAKFIKTLHTLETPHFSTLLFFDRVFSDLSYTVSCCTENEVRRYGHFLYQLLDMVSRWHSSETCYNNECANTPGFISMMRSSGSGSEKQYLDFENYRHITFKWHFKLTKSLVICLESKDYIQIRNGLILLTKILPHYPKVHHLSLALEKRVEKIMEEEKDKRQDLYILAIGYAGMLKGQKSNLVPEHDFHKRVATDNEPKPVSNTTVREKDVPGSENNPISLINTREEKQKNLDKMKIKEETPKVSTSQGTTTPMAKVELKLKKIDREEIKEKSASSNVSVNVTNTSNNEDSSKKNNKTNVTVSANSGQVNRTGSSDSLSAGNSPARTGQKKAHARSPIPDGNSTDVTSDRETKRRKIEDTTKPIIISDDKSPHNDKDKEIIATKPERKRERAVEKETTIDSVKRKKESIESHTPVQAATKEPSTETKERKRVLKITKSDKMEIGKKRTKSPMSEKEETKRHSLNKPIPKK